MLAAGLTGCERAQHPSASDQPAGPEPTSFELIDRALKAAQIDEETAYKYRVFAGFGDTRLPESYRGGDARVVEPPDEVEEAGARLASFSAATRSELEPFFKRPDEPGSWITLSTIHESEEPLAASSPAAGLHGDAPFLQSGVGTWNWPGRGWSIAKATTSPCQETRGAQWQTFCAAGGHAKVWAQTRYPGDAAKAAALADALSTHIWDKLNNLMGPDPWTDNGFPNNGGDPALDFYLVRMANEGVARSSDPAQSCHPSRYLLINGARPLVGSRGVSGVLDIAAHELMHAIQYAYPTTTGCPASWIREASATWAENFVYPAHNDEQGYAPSYLNSVFESIDNPLTPSLFEYGAYLLPFFLEKTGGGAGFMPRMWDNFRTMGDLHGVNAVIPGGFVKAWPKFLIQNWNRSPVDNPDGYKGWDRLPDGASPWGGLESMSAPNMMATATISFPSANGSTRWLPGLPYLSGLYKHFRFDRTVRSVVFDNVIAQMTLPHSSVWGIEKIDGTWKQPADWIGEPRKTWCRDRSSENLEELVIIFGNSDWQGKKYLNPPEPSTITVYPTGCTAFVGTSHVTQTMNEAVTLIAKADATVRFEPDPDLANSGGPTEHWRAVSGIITWSANASGECSGSASGTVPIRPFAGADGNHLAMLWIADDGSGPTYSGGTGPIPDAVVPKLTVTCPHGPVPLPVLVGGWWGPDPQGHPVPPGGTLLSGTYSMPGLGPNHSVKWTWSLRASP